jgi:hypothetical protein
MGEVGLRLVQMTPDEFRAIALSFPDTEEWSHMNHPDFRVKNKIFATLGPDLTWGMASLTREQQRDFMLMAPEVFRPSAGKWGEKGSTQIALAAVHDETLVREAVGQAWQNVGSKAK